MNYELKKKCKNCGKDFDASSSYCHSCGAGAWACESVEDASSVGASSPLCDVSGGMASAFSPDPVARRVYAGSDYLVQNILMVVVCCLFPSGIAGLILSCIARSAKRNGDWKRALVSATAAKTLFYATPFLVVACIFGSGAVAGGLLGGARGFHNTQTKHETERLGGAWDATSPDARVEVELGTVEEYESEKVGDGWDATSPDARVEVETWTVEEYETEGVGDFL